jgi:protoporphyrinogen IX oxidase
MFLLAKFLHVAAVGLWFAGLCLLPQLLAARAVGSERDDEYFVPIGRRLYFHLMTPAAVVAVVVGAGLIGFSQPGAWLPAKLLLVALALALHVYLGLSLYDMSNGRVRHGRWFFRSLGWTPFALAIGILLLTSVKPLTLAPVDEETVIPALPVPLDPGADAQPDDSG